MVRAFLVLFCLAVGLPAAQAAAADDYPSRPVRIVVPFTPGGPTDTYARVVADKLQNKFGQAFYIENKPGATGGVGAGFVASAPADGYTLLFASNRSHVIGPLLRTKKSFDQKHFKPLSILLRYPLYLVVSTNLPVNNKAAANLAPAPDRWSEHIDGWKARLGRQAIPKVDRQTDIPGP